MSKINCPSSNIDENICFKTYNIKNIGVYVAEMDFSNMPLNYDNAHKIKTDIKNDIK